MQERNKNEAENAAKLRLKYKNLFIQHRVSKIWARIPKEFLCKKWLLTAKENSQS